jgi:formylglycine-generating enzyme required for sulfatase activity
MGAGLWGQLDLAGEVLEWTADWAADYVNPCTDCAYLSPTADRATRGGHFAFSASELCCPAFDGGGTPRCFSQADRIVMPPSL